jgi:RNA polymerase sigma factor (sigma-70 family)
VVVAGLGWPARADVAPAITPRHDMPPTSAPARTVEHDGESDPRGDQPRHTVPQPRPLAPGSPSDGRDSPDPFVVADGNRYVLYSTQVGLLNVPVATSPDLRHWTPASDALPQLPGWAVWGRTWAGVTRLGGRYLLYFAAQHRASGRQCIGVAVSVTATGPFVSPSSDPLVCQTHLGGFIDPHPFVDADGSPYLLWKADGNAIGQPSTLFAQRLSPCSARRSPGSTRIPGSGASRCRSPGCSAGWPRRWRSAQWPASIQQSGPAAWPPPKPCARNRAQVPDDVNAAGSLRLCRSVDGPRTSFDEAFRSEYPGVVRMISPIVGSVEDAEAVTQDAFVKAYARWNRVGGYDRPGAWIRRVAIRDAVRFAERRRRSIPEVPVERESVDSVARTVDLQAALSRLSVKQRVCVVLHYLVDWPVAEVAEAIGCREATVRVHLHRARNALAGLLEPDAREMTDGR